MDTALNQDGVCVYAASAHPGTAFRCPVCRVRVIHVPGPKQLPHFRHSARTPIEERRIQHCPNYVADLGGGTSGTYHGRIAAPPAPPRPRLAVGWVRSTGEAQRWALLTTIPVPPAAVAAIRIDDYINGAADIHRDLVLRNRQFFVRANSRQYQVVGYDQARRAVWQPPPTDLLALSGLNFFRAGANGGLQLEPGEPLVRGRTYLAGQRWRSSDGNGSGGVSRSESSLMVRIACRVLARRSSSRGNSTRLLLPM